MSVQLIDLDNPMLLAAATALAPGHLRIGGSEVRTSLPLCHRDLTGSVWAGCRVTRLCMTWTVMAAANGATSLLILAFVCPWHVGEPL